jgi:hypothetical protein
MFYRLVEVVMNDLSSPRISPFAGRLSPSSVGEGRSRVVKVRLSLRERDAFYQRAYAEYRAPSLLLRSFAEAYGSGATVPSPSRSNPPGRETTQLAGPIAFAVPRDLYERLRARAQADCGSVSPVLRRFVLAYVAELANQEAA